MKILKNVLLFASIGLIVANLYLFVFRGSSLTLSGFLEYLKNAPIDGVSWLQIEIPDLPTDIPVIGYILRFFNLMGDLTEFGLYIANKAVVLIKAVFYYTKLFF